VSETPASARRRVRLAVRRAREDKGLTQAAVAEAMEWSLSKVMRIESGEVNVAPNDLKPLLSYLGVTNRTTVDELIAAAKLSRQRRQWWDAPDVKEGLTPALKQVVQLEPEASAIRYFVPLIFPGRLQTDAYSRAVLRTFDQRVKRSVLDARHNVRMRRRESLVAAANPTIAYVLLDESVFHRRIGGVQVLAEQLADTLRLIEEKRVYVRTIPLEAAAPVSMLGTYEIIYLSPDEDEGDAVMYRESDLEDEIVDEADEIRRHRTTYESIWRSSYDESRSIDLIKKRISELTSSANPPL
jgi:transcriptional regulator with XRE-family HTH domain